MTYPNNAVPNVPGASAQPPGDNDAAVAYLLTMFSGEVLATLREKNVFMDLTRTMNVGAGTSHQFPVLGQATAKRHTRGDSIIGATPSNYLSSIETGQRLISVDRPIVSSFTVDDWDELLTHFEFRGEYATQLGEALARYMDQQIAKVLVKAAKEGPTITSQTGKGGQEISVANTSTNPEILLDQIRTAAAGFEERDVRSEDLQFFVRPAMYFQLVDNGEMLNRDYGGIGSKAQGLIDSAYGFKIGMSNNLPITNDLQANADPGDYNTYWGDYRKTVAIGFHKDAVGTVYRENLMVETDRLVEYQQDLVVARMITGTGILRPECACVIEDPNQ